MPSRQEKRDSAGRIPGAGRSNYRFSLTIQSLWLTISHIMPRMQVARIYLIRCGVTGEGYVGRTARSLLVRFREHQRDAAKRPYTPLHEAFRRHGVAAFTIELLQQCLPDESAACEIAWIERLGTRVHQFGYNATAGGDGVPPPSAVDRVAWEANRQAVLHQPAVLARRIAAIREAHQQPETREAHRRAAVERYSDPAERERHGVALRGAFANPAIRLQRSVNASVCWTDPGYRDRHAAAMAAVNADPTVGRRKSASIKATWARRKAAAASGSC
jgi:hypothetical protein